MFGFARQSDLNSVWSLVDSALRTNGILERRMDALTDRVRVLEGRLSEAERVTNVRVELAQDAAEILNFNHPFNSPIRSF